MPEREDDGIDGRPSEEALERMLTELGPLLRRRAEVGAPDPTFAARLRAQLAPQGVDDRDTGEEPVVARPSPPRGQRRWRRYGYVAGIAAALIVAVLITVVGVLRPQRHGHTPAVAWRPPLPSLADLTRGFPAPSVAHAAGPLSPTMSLAAPPHGLPYAGHVRLSTTVPLSTHPFLLQAFRLVPPTTVAAPERVARLARHLGIHASIQRTTRGRGAWLVAAERGAPSSRLLRSVAVSLVTGELVYHDASYARQERWRDNAYAVSAARAWLTRLGWPGARMPLTDVEHSGIPRGLREIEFSWVGVGAVATDAATLWLTPGGRVVEADVWPPVESARTIPVRRLTAAWTAVRGRLVPLAVVGVPPQTTAPGVGVMRHVTITDVMSTGTDRRLYLVPTYHFAGSARLRGMHGEHICYALAPAGQPRRTT